MKCEETQDVLSAYHDGELPVDIRSSVAQHVRECSRCRDELQLFERMSAMAKGLDDPEPPEQIWAGIEASLDAEAKAASTDRSVVERKGAASKWRWSLLATAAVVLITTGVVMIASRTWQVGGQHPELAANFEQYLKDFPRDPAVAQQRLLAKYDGQAVDLAQATQRLGYRPAVAGGLPERYQLDSLHVLKMPCCTCVQTICRRDDGQVFAIFEHDQQQPVWFGGRPQITTQCHGCPCSVIQTDRGLVASWKADKRQLTVIGARDLDDIADLVTYFQTRSPEA